MLLKRSLLFLIGMMAIAAVVMPYKKLGMTADEGYHLWCGMQWWETGEYNREPKHTALVRIAMSAPIYWGKKLFHLNEYLQQQAPVDAYVVKASLARVGVLPFYITSLFLVFIWSRSLFGYAAGIWSVALYGLLSTVTAHAGLVTTDMGYTSMFVFALLMGVRWLESPTPRRCILLGISLALMVGSKFSGVAQWPIAMCLIVLLQAWHNKCSGKSIIPITWAHITRAFTYTLPFLVLVLGVIYRFDYYPLYVGFQQLIQQNDQGFAIWLFGPLPKHGVWYFFPVVFFFKTPLAFLLLALIAVLLLLREHAVKVRPQVFFPLLGAVGVMGISMTSHINLGVRHVLPVYPLLAILAGYAAHRAWAMGRAARCVALALLVWIAQNFFAHAPDHISYYNELAGESPEHVSLDSDFDWGQGTLFAREELMKLGIKKVFLCVRKVSVRDAREIFSPDISYSICEHPDKRDMSVMHPLKPLRGWVVMSKAMAMRNPQLKLAWLGNRKALHHIGRIWDLYYVLEPHENKSYQLPAGITRSFLCSDPAFWVQLRATTARRENWQTLCGGRQDLLSGIRPHL